MEGGWVLETLRPLLFPGAILQGVVPSRFCVPNSRLGREGKDFLQERVSLRMLLGLVFEATIQ